MKFTREKLIEHCDRNCNMLYVFQVTKIGYKYLHYRRIGGENIYKIKIQGFSLHDFIQKMVMKTWKGKKIYEAKTIGGLNNV